MDYRTLPSLEGEENRNITPDRLARQEEADASDHYRGEYLKKHIHRVAVSFVYIISVIMIAILIIRVWHVATPCCWRWLNNEDLHNIERALFSGLILSFAGKYFKKYKIVDE